MFKYNVLRFCGILLQVAVTLSMGGHKGTIKDAPFVVQIYVGEDFCCGGTLVHKQFVVTAGHKVNRYPTKELIVKAGAEKLSDEGIESRVSGVFYPEKFNSRSLDMDVAVLKLQTPIEGNLVTPAKLCSKNLIEKAQLQTYSWGSRSVMPNIKQNTKMQKTQFKLISQSDCLKKYYFQPATENMFCATRIGKGVCDGDGGSPGIIDGEFCGIVLSSFFCSLPTIFTNISKVQSFIEETISYES